jgi:hypothetical protein
LQYVLQLDVLVKKTASEENFTKLINEHLLSNKGCEVFREIGLSKVEIRPRGWLVPKEGEGFKKITDDSRIFDILTEDGLYTVQKSVDKSTFGQDLSIYTLTENGKTALGTDGSRKACASFYEIDSFKNFTKTSEVFTTVHFNIKFKSVAPWVVSVQKRKTDFYTNSNPTKSYPLSVNLSLMSDGWQVN